MLVIKVNEILATFIGTNSQTLLWEGSILFDAPDFKNPVGI
jgi:hypothetical protein